MEDPAYLRRWGQGSWPTDEFTLAENIRDLERHQREHLEGSAFTYTVLSPEGDRCLGCVYITPIGVRITADQIPQPHRPGPESFTADVCFWVRLSLHADDLDSMLLSALKIWLQGQWQFDHTFFHTSLQDRRQQEIFTASGLEKIAQFQADRPRPGGWMLYRLM